MLRSFTIICVLCVFSWHYSSAQHLKTDIYFLTLSNPKVAITELSKQIEQSSLKQQHEVAASALLNRASVLRKIGNYDDAIYDLITAQNIITFNFHEGRIKDSLLGVLNETFGRTYINRYNESKSIGFFAEATRYYLSSNNTDCVARSIKMQIHSCLASEQENEARKLLNYLEKLQAMFPSELTKGNYLESKGYFADNNGDYSMAASFYQKAQNMYERADDIELISDMYAYISRSFFSDKNYEKCQEWTEKGIQFTSRNKYVGGFYEILFYKISVIGLTSPVDALTLTESHLQDIEESGWLTHQGLYLATAAKYAESLRNFEKAFYYSKLFITVINETYGLKSEQRISDMILDLYTDNLNLRIESLNSEKDLNERIRHGQQNMIYYFVIALFVLLMVSVGNLKRLQFRLFLFREYMLDIMPLSAFFIAFEVYFFLLLSVFNSAFVSVNSDMVLHVHTAILAAIPSIIMTLGMAFLPGIWSTSPEKNRSFSTVAYLGLVLINSLVLVYYLSFELIGWNLYEILNIVFIFTGLIVVPLFFMVIYIEKVMLRKHVHDAGLMNTKIRQSEKLKKTSSEIIRIVSDKSKDVFESSVSNLLLVEGQSNYAKFYYIDKGELKTTLLLVTMKQAEHQLMNHKEFIRCHKSNIVNITQVKKVKGNSHGYKLSVPPIEEFVTVSKSYVGEFNDAFSRFSGESNP